MIGQEHPSVAKEPYMSLFRFGAIGLALLAMATPFSLADDKQVEVSPAEAVRKGLDQTITLDFNAQSMQEAITHLKEKTKINFVLDVFTIQQMGVLFDENGNPLGVHLKADKGKLRHAL